MSDKGAFRLIAGITILVMLIIVLLKLEWLKPEGGAPVWIYYFPLFNAILNGRCAIILLFSYRAIKQQQIDVHKRLNITAFCLSALFILLYVSFHLFVPNTSYGGEGLLKTLYLFILASHIILAALVLPLILISFWFGLKMNIKRHRKIVRYTFPIWLYVAITGVLVYLMISPYYNFH
jgi:putative membrane protein